MTTAGCATTALRTMALGLFLGSALLPGIGRAADHVVLLPMEVSRAGLAPPDRRAFEDALRMISSEALRDDGFDVVPTVDTKAALVSAGVDPDQPCTSECPFMVAAKLRASRFMQGTMTRSGAELVATVRLYEISSPTGATEIGHLILSGGSLLELENGFTEGTRSLFHALHREAVLRASGGTAAAGGWILAGVGALALVSGVVLFFQTNATNHETTAGKSASPAQPQSSEVGPDILMGVGAAAMVAGGVTLIVTVPHVPQGAGGDGAWGVAVSGRF